MEIGLYRAINGRYYVNWGTDGRVPYLNNRKSFKTKRQAMKFSELPQPKSEMI